jgi:hypothetical protein
MVHVSTVTTDCKDALLLFISCALAPVQISIGVGTKELWSSLSNTGPSIAHPSTHANECVWRLYLEWHKDTQYRLYDSKQVSHQ